MHLNLNSAISVRQKNPRMNDPEHNKTKDDKYKMMPGQQHLAALEAKGITDCSHILMRSPSWASGRMESLRIPPPSLAESWGWAFRWSSRTAAPEKGGAAALAGRSWPYQTLHGESQESRGTLPVFTARVNRQVPHKLKNVFFQKLFEDDFCPV